MSLPMQAGTYARVGRVGDRGRGSDGVRYGVRRRTGRVDLDEVRDLALRERPKIVFCGGTAVPRTVDFAGFA